MVYFMQLSIRHEGVMYVLSIDETSSGFRPKYFMHGMTGACVWVYISEEAGCPPSSIVPAVVISIVCRRGNHGSRE